MKNNKLLDVEIQRIRLELEEKEVGTDEYNKLLKELVELCECQEKLQKGKSEGILKWVDVGVKAVSGCLVPLLGLVFIEYANKSGEEFVEQGERTWLGVFKPKI